MGSLGWQHRLSLIEAAETIHGVRILAYMGEEWRTAMWDGKREMWLGDGLTITESRGAQPKMFRRLPPPVDEAAIQRTMYHRRGEANARA